MAVRIIDRRRGAPSGVPLLAGDTKKPGGKRDGKGKDFPEPGSSGSSGSSGNVNLYLPTVELRRGQCGPAVELWQRWLWALSPVVGSMRPREIDGLFDDETDTVTRSAQRALDVYVDGRVGPKTRAAAFARLERAGALPDRDPFAEVVSCDDWGAADSSGGSGIPDLTDVIPFEYLLVGGLLVVVALAKR
ncbi:MAG: peptidoglycan-binding protein [Bacteroidota bacterium]